MKKQLFRLTLDGYSKAAASSDSAKLWLWLQYVCLLMFRQESKEINTCDCCMRGKNAQDLQIIHLHTVRRWAHSKACRRRKRHVNHTKTCQTVRKNDWQHLKKPETTWIRSIHIFIDPNRAEHRGPIGPVVSYAPITAVLNHRAPAALIIRKGHREWNNLLLLSWPCDLIWRVKHWSQTSQGSLPLRTTLISNPRTNISAVAPISDRHCEAYYGTWSHPLIEKGPLFQRKLFVALCRTLAANNINTIEYR